MADRPTRPADFAATTFHTVWAIIGLLILAPFVISCAGCLAFAVFGTGVAAVSEIAKKEDVRREPTSPPVQNVANDLLGHWRCVSETADGESIVPRVHFWWEFDNAGTVLMNDRRPLRFELRSDGSHARLQIYNQIDGRRLNVYSCLYQVSSDRLRILFNAGDSYPVSFDTHANWSSILLEFEKVEDF